MNSMFLAVITFFAFALSACGGADFRTGNGSSKRSKDSTSTEKSSDLVAQNDSENEENQDEDEAAGEENKELSGLDEEDLTTVQSCLDQVSGHPFSTLTADNFRKISFGGFISGGSEIIDNKVTDEPALIVIEHQSLFSGKLDLQLLNPNGWYCIKSSTFLGGKLNIKVQCDAHLLSTERKGLLGSGISLEYVGGDCE